MNRRDFLKTSALGSVLAAGAVIAKPGIAEAAGIGTKQHNSIDDVVEFDPAFKRFEMSNTAFSRAMLASKGMLPPNPNDNQELLGMFSGKIKKDPFPQDKPGYTQLDRALNTSIGATEKLTGSGRARTQSGDSAPTKIGPNGELIPYTLYGQTSASFFAPFEVAKEQWKFASQEEAAYAVKKAAKLAGADLVGIAPFDERFVYATETYVPTEIDTGKPIIQAVNPKRPVEFGFTPKSVVVLAFEMDYESYKTQPCYIGGSATTQGYARMAEVSLRVAVFLRELGYNTRHAGNDTGLSVPIAIQAGLGEGSRMGLLITEEFGPRVRLAKVYTDLDMKADKPKTFGVTQFCEVCRLCADTCPSKALSHVKSANDPANVPLNESNLAGVRKWQNDGQKCLTNWNLPFGGAECGLCITVCPYNKLKEWNHDLAKVVTRVPGLNGLARYFDEFFGYGGVADDQTIADFWRKTI